MSNFNFSLEDLVEYFEYIVTDSELEALVLENNLIKEYPSYKIAEKTTGISHISDACNGNRKSAGGYIWKWLPFKKMIGDIKAISEVIKDAYND